MNEGTYVKSVCILHISISLQASNGKSSVVIEQSSCEWKLWHSDPHVCLIDLRLAQKASFIPGGIPPSHSAVSPRKLTDVGRRIPMICDI